LLFGLLTALIGMTLIWYGIDEKWWTAFGLGAGFLTFAFLAVRNALSWLRYKSGDSLTLFEDYFCVGSERYPYTAFQGVTVRRPAHGRR
jgi:hypothetical protein